MSRRTLILGAVALLALVVLGLGIAMSQGQDRLNLAPLRDLGPPVVNGRADVLIPFADGADVVIGRIPQGETSPERNTVLTVGGLVDTVQVATHFDSGSGEGKTLAVVSICPDRFAEPEPDFENAKVCIGKPRYVSFELDSGGNRTSEPVPLPEEVLEGRLFATDDEFIWAWTGPAPEGNGVKAERALYLDETWHPLTVAPPTEVPARDQCTTSADLWVMHAYSGPQSQEGLGSAVTRFPNFSLFRYRLTDGSSDGSWIRVEVPGLEASTLADLACGRNAAYVVVNDTLYEIADQARPVDGIEGRIYDFRDTRGRLPIVFVSTAPGESKCALIGRLGEPVFASEPPSSADQNRTSVCNGEPWEIDGQYIVIQADVRNGDISIRPW